jgi:anti-anti-sigma factor
VVAASPHTTWVSAAGKLVGEAPAARLSALLARERTAGRRFVRLDLCQVSMLDHAGLDTIIEAHHRFLALGGTLVLTGVGPRIARLLELTELDKTLFTIARAGDQSPTDIDRPVIDRAVGVVMGRARCGVTDATERLAMLSQATNRTLGQVAQSILSEPAVPAAARPQSDAGRTARIRPTEMDQ